MPTKMIDHNKHVIDARGRILGRLATEAANLLRGKAKLNYEPNLDCGDFVVITNAAAVEVTGNKLEDKIYSRHSGHPGGLKQVQLKTLMANEPEKVVTMAISGMLPKNRLNSRWLRRLKIYAGEEK